MALPPRRRRTGDLHSGLKPSDVSSTFRTPATVADAANHITPAHFVGASNFYKWRATSNRRSLRIPP
jgi:hypothetical protein